MQELTEWSRGLSVQASGKGQVGKAGAVLLRALADRTGLTSGLSHRLRAKGRTVVHDRGRLLVDLAVVLCLGGKALADVRLLDHLAKVFGPGAAPSTLWRALKALDARAVDRICAVRARTRVHVWQQLALRPGGFPWLRVARHTITGWIVLDVDATLVNTASPKQGAAATWKKGFGYHPIAVTCDNTREMLAVHLRPGNAGSNTVADHIAVLAEAVRQVPARLRHRILIRADGAGGTRGLIDWIRSGGGNKRFTWHYSLGFTVTEDLEKLIMQVPRLAWRAAMNVASRPIGDTWVVEITGRTGLQDWPDDMRLIIRRSRIHPRDRNLTAYEKKSGWRYSALVTNTPDAPGRDEVWLEARHRSHTHVEAAIKSAKQTGLRRMPSREFAINHAWCQAVALAVDLTAWLQHLALDGEEARAEPDTVRLRILDIPARLVHGGRRRTLKLADDWPWSQAVADAYTRIQALPALN